MIETVRKIFDIEAEAIRNIPLTDAFEQAVGIIRSWLKEPVKAGAVPAKAA